MRSQSLAWVSVVVLFLGELSGVAETRLGVAAVNINPPPGMGLAGYYHPRGSEGVLDDLSAKALVLDDGSNRVAVVICDLLTLPRWIIDAARKSIELQTGIPASHVLIAATHTHTAPVLYLESNPNDPAGDSTGAVKNYSHGLAGLIAQSVEMADHRRQGVRLFAGTESEGSLARNRRWWMRDGTVAWNPGKNNPDRVRPAGPTDPEVGVLYAEASDGPATPVCTFVNYAMHPDTTGGNRLSADYPGALARVLALYKGPSMLTLFANGTCGNLNHVDVAWAAPQTSPQEAARLGVILASAVLRAYPKLRPLTNSFALQVSSEQLLLQLPGVSPTDVQTALSDAQTARDDTRDGFMKLVRARRILDVAAREGRPLEVEVQVITLGRDLAWVSWPGEIFVELGLSVKAASPFPYTYNVELANGAIGYIPNRSAWPEGNYEVESARVAPGSGEELVASALRQLAALYARAH